MVMDSQISRRKLLKSGAGTAVVSALGAGGLLELLANRKAVAAGTVIAVVGVTGETGDRGKASGEAHRHTFSASFIVKALNRHTGRILGDIIGRTGAVLSTGDGQEDFHIHNIRMMNVTIDEEILTLVADQHRHLLSVN
jgi:hypothetical protein